MKSTRQIEKSARKIANAIVELVELEDGPVTLAQINRDVPGFAKEDRPSWSYHLDSVVGRCVIWDGMTEAGYIALRGVLSNRRVAVQWVDARPYRIEHHVLPDTNWHPLLLLPVKGANLDSPDRLLRVSPEYQQHWLKRAAEEKIRGYRAVTPVPLRFTTDQFCIT